ncbi:transposase [Streptomyces sp. NPDC058382]|uniref:transposase n=1 Tax=unclassified Streptomyces TaxID=2593676 RepID=UPI00363FE652
MPASSRGYTAGKKCRGTSATSWWTALACSRACDHRERPGRHAAAPLLKRVRDRRRKIMLVWADGGYAGRLVVWAKEKLQFTVQIVRRSDDVSGFVVLPRRWCVERTFAWLFRSRRLVRDYETLPAVHEWMVMWSMAMLMSRRMARRRA